ncbi:hypothetical protein FACS1894184_03640 [Clostridia bacterium]|nr:hypothetical protein FACS1894184_03640 [Clostridia bacterium]
MIKMPLQNTKELIKQVYYPLKTLLYQLNRRTRDELDELNNKYADKRCFIIGNGPSLEYSDLTKLQNEYCFACNSIYKAFHYTDWRPSFYIVTDRKFKRNNLEAISQITSKFKFVENFCLFPCIESRNDTLEINVDHRSFYKLRRKCGCLPFSNKPSKRLIAGGTVIYVSIQLALHLGFKEIYLIGVDHNYKTDKKHFYDESAKKASADIEKMTDAYRTANIVSLNLGCKIYNATRGGELNEFERIEFDKLVLPDN